MVVGCRSAVILWCRADVRAPHCTVATDSGPRSFGCNLGIGLFARMGERARGFGRGTVIFLYRANLLGRGTQTGIASGPIPRNYFRSLGITAPHDHLPGQIGARSE